MESLIECLIWNIIPSERFTTSLSFYVFLVIAPATRFSKFMLLTTRSRLTVVSAPARSYVFPFFFTAGTRKGFYDVMITV